jgi:hypothetical protein
MYLCTLPQCCFFFNFCCTTHCPTGPAVHAEVGDTIQPRDIPSTLSYLTLSAALTGLQYAAQCAGPALHAEVGDTIQLVLRNNLDFPINVMVGGVSSEGAPLVNPGDTYTAK